MDEDIVIQENIPLAPYTSFQIGGNARYFCVVVKEQDIPRALSVLQKTQLPVFILGEGSNTIFSDTDIFLAILQIKIKGIKKIIEEKDSILVSVGAGEIWDDFVLWAVQNGYSGIEALSAIPGTVGATPVQNVGAYGQEVGNVIQSVKVYDIKEKQFKTLENSDCHFRYRDSIFKSEEKGRYIISEVIFKLSREKGMIPEYPGVKEYFYEQKIQHPNLLQIRDAICTIRWKKLPDPKKIPNAGSFFKNPFISVEQFEILKQQFPDIKSFQGENGKIKISAGWLIDQCNLKGKDFGTIRIFENNALVLVNNGGATMAQLLFVRDLIVKTVSEKFGITLESEPNIMA